MPVVVVDVGADACRCLHEGQHEHELRQQQPDDAGVAAAWAAVHALVSSVADRWNSNVQNIKWLGVRPSDLDRFNIPKACRIKMTDEDIKTGKKMVRCVETFSICA